MLLASSSRGGASSLLVCLLGVLLSASSSSQQSFLVWWLLLCSWWLLALGHYSRNCLTCISNAWFYCIRASFCCVSQSTAAESICSCLSTVVWGFPVSKLTDAIDRVWAIWAFVSGVERWLITQTPHKRCQPMMLKIISRSITQTRSLQWKVKSSEPTKNRNTFKKHRCGANLKPSEGQVRNDSEIFGEEFLKSIFCVPWDWSVSVFI